MAYLKHTLLGKIAAAAMIAAALTGGCDAGGTVSVGPRGGTVVSDDGRFVLDVPAGALDRVVDLAVIRMPCAQLPALSECYAVEPTGIVFARPATVTVELAGMVPTALGVDRPTIMVHKTGGWRPLADRTHDPELELVSASAGYASEFAVVDLH